MSFDSEFISLQKKKKKKEGIAPVKADPFSEELINLQQKNIDKQIANRKKVEANGTGYFKTSRGTVAEKILGTGVDAATNILQGLGNTGEGIVDLATYGVSNLSKALFGDNQFSQNAKKFAQKDLVNTGAEWLGSSNGLGYDSSSVLGNKTENIAQGLGQILGMYITAGIGGKLGLAEKGVSALNTGVLFASSTGQGMTEAYKDGATDKEAAAYGVLKGGVEAGSEAIFGGLGKGVKALGVSKGLSSADDILAKALTQKITNRVLSNAVQLGVKSTGEGLEEVAAGIGSAVAKKLTYKREKGENLWDLIKDEKLLDSFVTGAITSGIAQSGGAIKSTIKDTDLVSGLTRNEEKVVNSVYEKTVANEEKVKGKKLTSTEKNKIYEQLTKDMERGKISTDDIESVLGGDTYTEYKGRIDQVENLQKKIDTLQKEHDELNAMKKGDMTGVQEDRLNELKKELPQLKSQLKDLTSDTKASEVADIKTRLSNEVASLVQNDRLSESYRENIRKEQHFTADLSKYTEKEAAIVKKAVDSGFLNDSNQTHDFVDLVAKLSAEKGIDFDFTTSKRLKESGFSLEGRVMNGKVDGNTVTINMNSAKALESVVGHEITHILEESPDLYNAVAEAVKTYATTKGEYDSRLKELTELYKDQKADVQKELVADLVGDYIFSDADFVRTLTTNHRNVAQKIYDEIKHMLKLATTGSKEARQLEKARKIFQDAFRDSTSTKTTESKDSLSSISNSFFGNPEMTVKEFAESDYKSTDGYKNYVEQCVGNMEQTHADFNEKVARKSVEKQIDGIIRVALASAEAGYNIKDTNEQRDTVDQKGRQLFSSLEPNSDYFTSHDVSTICDKSKNFTEIYDEIVRVEQSKGVPKGKGFFDNINNYFYLHKVLADKGLTQPCRQCYVDSMRKNLAPMAKNFLTLIQETDVNNKANDQLYNKSGKNKGQLKSNNAKLRENILKILEEHPEYNLTANTITVDMLSTENGLAELRLQAPYVYEAFNSFYGQSKPKMPKSPTPFRFGELTALLTDEHGKIKQNLVDRINSTGGFRLQSYSDFQIANYTDVLQVLFEAGTLGLHGHAYTKVPAFLEATDGTNLKRNISIFMYKDGNEWKIDRNDSFPMALEDIYDIVNADKNGNTGIIAVSQNNDMSAWIMANDNIAYGIPFHKSGHKMGTVRDTDVKTEDGRTIKGYKDAKDHTRQQTEVWKTTTADHKALTKVKKGIDIYQFWDFDNAEGLSHNDLIKKNLKNYIDACEEAGYIPKFRDYVMNNTDILNKTLAYGKKLGFLSEDATIEDISFKYKGYTIPYGYYKFLGDFGMFKPNGEASPIVPISLENYDFDKAVEFFKDAETVRRNEILQQFANDGKRTELRESGMNAEQLQKELAKMRGEVVSQIVDGKKSLSYADATPTTKGTYGKDLLLEDEVIEVETPKAVAPIKAEKTAPTKKIAPIKSQDVAKESQEVVSEQKTFEVGTKVRALDRDNLGVVQSYNEDANTYTVKFQNKKGETAVVELDSSLIVEPYSTESTARKVAEQIKTTEAKIESERRLQEESSTRFDEEIQELQQEYESKKNKNTQVANKILRGIENLKVLKSNSEADSSRKISRLEEKLTKLNSPVYIRAAQAEAKRQQYSSEMSDVAGDTSTWVDKKMGIQYKVNTLRRNLRDIVRDENGKKDIARADAIYDILQGNYNHNEAELNREATKIKKVYADMKINNAESEYIQMLGEYKYNPDTTLTKDIVEDFYKKNESKIDIDKVNKAIEMARGTYDDLLLRVNEVLREQGMKEIPYRKGYFPHFTNEKQGVLGKIFNWKTQNNDIPTDIAGLTENFNPNRSWQSFNKERKGDKTDYNFLQGMDAYVQGALDWIYHIEDIQRRRAFENNIRYEHSEQGIKDAIEKINANEEYDADERQAQIELVYEKAQNPLNNFVTDLRTATNTLAGKKSSLDRVTEEYTRRKIYSTMTNINGRVSANMVAGSVSSALTNFIPITQSWMQVSPLRSIEAMYDTLKSAISDDGVVNKSNFLTNRIRQHEKLYQTNWDKVIDKAAFLMNAVDEFTSQVVWRSKYNQNIANGMSETEAIKNANQFAENVIAGRSRGNQPTLFDAKNPLAKMFTTFQLEVNNQYGYMFKDAPTDLKTETKHWKSNLVKGYAMMYLGAYAYNALYSSLTGRDAAFDPIGIIEDLLRDLGWIGDDEEEEPIDVVKNFSDNIIDELPFVGSLSGGGRIPLNSAMPYDGLEGMIFDTAEDFSKGNYGKLTSEWLNPVYYLAFPAGGGQIRKTLQGLSMFGTNKDRPVTGSYTASGDLRFPVEKTFGNVLQAGVFGQWSNKNARDYIENNRNPLSEKQIKEYVDVKLPIKEYWEYRDGLKGLKKLEEKADYIYSLDLPMEKKNLLINNIADRKEPIDLTNYGKYDSFEEFDYAQKNPEKYAFLEQEGIGYEGYKALDSTTKDSWSWAFKHQDKYFHLKKNGVTPDDYDIYRISMLDFDDESNEAYEWSFDYPEKATVSKAVASNDAEYRTYTKALSEFHDDEVNGKKVSGSRKKKVASYIANLDIDNGAKAILYKSEYPSYDKYNAYIVNYLISRNDISASEMKTILTELGFKVSANGRISW
jgi:hypothetical protein